jgi:uncharacterized protein
LKRIWSDRKVILFRGTAVLLLAIAGAVVAHANSKGLDISHTSIAIAGIPAELDGLHIAQVSDLHSSWFGEGQIELVDAIGDFKPDIIAVTGDFIDGINPDSAPCIALVRGLALIAPVYIIMGNHEYYLDEGKFAAFMEEMQDSGAIVLINRAVTLERRGENYLLSGMDDVTRFQGNPRANEIGREQYAMEIAEGFMAQLRQNEPEGDFPLKIMLCHQPPYWQLWRDGGYDLALCGHLHGWIARLPGIGGLLRKPSMYFPEEDAGLYDKQGILVYISRGLDNQNTLSNFRMNNKPELALIEITSR